MGGRGKVRRKTHTKKEIESECGGPGRKSERREEKRRQRDEKEIKNEGEGEE